MLFLTGENDRAAESRICRYMMLHTCPDFINDESLFKSTERLLNGLDLLGEIKQQRSLIEVLAAARCRNCSTSGDSVFIAKYSPKWRCPVLASDGCQFPGRVLVLFALIAYTNESASSTKFWMHLLNQSINIHLIAVGVLVYFYYIYLYQQPLVLQACQGVNCWWVGGRAVFTSNK